MGVAALDPFYAATPLRRYAAAAVHLLTERTQGIAEEYPCQACCVYRLHDLFPISSAPPASSALRVYKSETLHRANNNCYVRLLAAS